MAPPKEQIVTIVTPESLSLELPLSTVGNRITSFLIDLFLIFVLSILLLLGVVSLTALFPYFKMVIAALAMISYFLLWNGYFIFFEMRSGTTPGKRLNNYKVICEDGTALSAGAIYIRNLMREVEVWLPIKVFVVAAFGIPMGNLQGIALLWIFLFVLVPFFDKKARRLGDLLAGTLVVTMPRHELEEDLSSKMARADQNEPFHFTSEMLDVYGKDELHVLEQILRGKEFQNQKEKEKLMAMVVEKISRKINYSPPVPKEEHLAFLQYFYQAQRAVLEKKLVRGENLRRKTRKLIKKITSRKKNS